MRALRRWGKVAARGGLILAAVGSVAGLVTGTVRVATSGAEVPVFAQVRAQTPSSETVYLSREGSVLRTERRDYFFRRLAWTELKEISRPLRQAVLISEDKRFFDHSGVDFKAIAAAVWSRLQGHPLRGASTISMQTVDLLAAPGRRGARGIWGKLRQMGRALLLEWQWTKTQILETYFNRVTFRGELQGIRAASFALFDKSPGAVGEAESLLLASLIRSPNQAPEQLSARACELRRRVGWEHVRCEELLALAQRLSSRAPLADAGSLPVVPGEWREVGRVAKSAVRTTLAARMQETALMLLRNHVLSLRGRQVKDGAVVVLDNASGEVLVYAGNIGADASAPHVDGARGLRQAGSTLKPFIYGLAFERGEINADSQILDSETDIMLLQGVYRPRNYDKKFYGYVTAREALASSLNVPAVKVLLSIGVDAAVELFGAMEFRELRPPHFYGPSLALGSLDVDLLTLTNAYRMLANGGVYSRPLFFADKAAPAGARRLFRRETADTLLSILSDREARHLTFGTDSVLNLPFWAAVKTGTSKDMRDNWCIGFSTKYTVGVWVGNMDGLAMKNVSGITGAGPVWHEVMRAIHTELPAWPELVVANSPSGKKVSGKVRRLDGKAVSGTPDGMSVSGISDRMSMSGISDHAADIKIQYPQDGLIVAVDPDIPPRAQKILVRTTRRSNNLTWYLNGRRVKSKVSEWTLQPTVGRHELQLKRGAEVLDTVRFEVR